MTTQEKIKLLESDLRDCTNPEILARWPNLGNPKLVEQLTQKLADARTQLQEENR